jgi:hypothetical protein
MFAWYHVYGKYRSPLAERRDYQAMKRHPSLEAFSRDHNVGLMVGRQLIRASSLDEGTRREAANTLLQYWEDELADHFCEEETLLAPLLLRIDLRERLMQEHLDFSKLVVRCEGGLPEPHVLLRTGNLLTEHIRWEERVLFPAIERAATIPQLDDLAEQTEVMEARHSGSHWSPRRGELIMKRTQDGVHSQVLDKLYRLAIERWEIEGGRLVP